MLSVFKPVEFSRALRMDMEFPVEFPQLPGLKVCMGALSGSGSRTSIWQARSVCMCGGCEVKECSCKIYLKNRSQESKATHTTWFGKCPDCDAWRTTKTAGVRVPVQGILHGDPCLFLQCHPACRCLRCRCTLTRAHTTARAYVSTTVYIMREGPTHAVYITLGPLIPRTDPNLPFFLPRRSA